MAYEAIIYEKTNGIARITLNRPDVLNALSGQLRTEIGEAVKAAGSDDDVRVIIIKGAGRAFSAGGDLSSGTPGQKQERATLRQDIESTLDRNELSNALWHSRKPIIAQIHGYCLGAATDLILHADILICAENARFGYPTGRAQGTPASHMWTYLVGPQWAKYMLFTGNALDGKTAERIGLVWKAVPADELEGEVNHLAETIVKVPYGLVALHKRIVNIATEMMGRSLVQQLAAEGDAMSHLEPSAAEFREIRVTKGMEAAVKWRDGKFGDYSQAKKPQGPS